MSNTNIYFNLKMASESHIFWHRCSVLLRCFCGTLLVYQLVSLYDAVASNINAHSFLPMTLGEVETSALKLASFRILLGEATHYIHLALLGAWQTERDAIFHLNREQHCHVPLESTSSTYHTLVCLVLNEKCEVIVTAPCFIDTQP